MAGKREKLRQGETVELEPGIRGRLNFKDRSLELSNGERLPISQKDQRELFPENEKQLEHAREKESIRQNFGKIPGGEFFYQLGQKGLAGAGKDWINKLILSGDDYLKRKNAEKEVSEEISEASPFTSGAATIASFVPDIALTHGMSAVKAAPLLTAASAGPRILEEPEQVAKEVGLSAVGGFLLDKGANFINRVVQRRKASRAIPQLQAEAELNNIAGSQAAEARNLTREAKYKAERNFAENQNLAREHQYNLELHAREQKMVEAQNAAKEAEFKNKRLNDEYSNATREYQDAIRNMPAKQQQAQDNFSKNVVNISENLQKSFPKGTKINGSQIKADEFIKNALSERGLSGTKEGTQAARIIKSLFPEEEIFAANELSKKYRAIEQSIRRASPEVKNILSDFKSYLGERLPIILEDTGAYNKILPSLMGAIEKDLPKILKVISFGRGEEATKNILLKTASSNIKNLMREISPKDFVQKLKSGEISELLSNQVLSLEDFLMHAHPVDIKKLRKQGLFDLVEEKVNAEYQFFRNQIDQSVKKYLSKNESKILHSLSQTAKKLKKELKSTFGIAEPIKSPLAPSKPELMPIPDVKPLPMPLKSTETPLPIQPQPERFIPQNMPVLESPRNVSERLGDILERPLLRGKGLINNPLTKLAGLKYLLGPAALPLEASYLGLKGITTPNELGELARLSFKRGGIQAIDLMAQRYSSYNNGILEDPKERRSLTKEIEEDQEIPIEQKAIIQSQINRGKPITGNFLQL